MWCSTYVLLLFPPLSSPLTPLHTISSPHPHLSSPLPPFHTLTSPLSSLLPPLHTLTSCSPHPLLSPLPPFCTSPPTHSPSLSPVTDTSYQLDVSLGVVQFHHHPLFNEEHVIAAELRQVYQQYTAKLEQNKPRILREKVRVDILVSS